MRRGYSRLNSVEEQKNLQKAVFFVILTALVVTGLFFIGIPTLGRFVAFVSDLGKSNKPITSTDKTPPPPPRFNIFPDFTNQKQVTLTGSAEPGSNVKLTFNGTEQDNIVDRDGSFSFSNLSLNDGRNSFSAVAIDPAGNTSQKTKEFNINFDNKPPDLTIDSPQDGTQFFGSNQRQITIQGTAEANAQVTVNDRIVAVDDNGKFQYTTTLNEGENKFTFKAADQAGNTTEKDLTLNFTP